MTARQSAVDVFAGFVLGSEFDTMPDAAVAAATTFFLDTVTVGIAGSTTETADRVLRTAGDWGQGDAATVLGGGKKLPSASAAFVNSFQIHCQEFDCLHEPATVHAMAVVGGAILAVAEERGYSGRDICLAVALGVDIAASLGVAASSGLRFFRPATAGALGAAAALARLEGFDERGFLDTWGLAYSQLAGTMQAHVEGSVALPLQIAAASRAAVNSVQLVRQGLGGPHDILEGPFGYFRLFEDGGNLDAVLRNVGKTWRVTELSHKPFPTGRAAHGTLEALALLRAERPFTMDEIVAVNARVPPLVKRLVDRPAVDNMQVNYARLCLEFLVPLFIRDGRVDLHSFSAANLADAELLQQGRKVSVIDDGNPDPNALGPQLIELQFSDGSRLERPIPHTIGSPENPLDGNALRQKALHCLATAGIAGKQADTLVTSLEDLPGLSPVTEWIGSCVATTQ